MAKMTSGMRMLAMAKAGQGGRMQNGAEMRRRDSRGRYMEDEDGPRMAYNDSAAMRTWPEPHIHPYLDKPGMYGGRDPHDKRYNPYGEEPEVYRKQRNESRPESYGGTINYAKADGGSGNISYFKTKHETDPLDQKKMMGFRQNEHHEEGKFDKQTAMEWVDSMEDKEGVKGGMYSWHQAQQYGRNLGITGEERLIEFYAAMNAMHSDFRAVAKKFGVDRAEFYAHMAKAFIEDPDAVEDKVAKYYECIAKKD